LPATPPPESEPLLTEQESFARLLRRATHPDPARRFQSASEMAAQLTGVLREVLATASGDPGPAFSGLFSPEVRAIGADLTPVRSDGTGGIRVRPPSAAEVIAGLPVPHPDDSGQAARHLAIAGEDGLPSAAAPPETLLALVRALFIAGDTEGAKTRLNELSASGPAGWRTAWYTGLREFAHARPEQARAMFSTVYDELPGEFAPKLALGFAAEAAGDLAAARHYYQLARTTDRSSVSAAFGTARTCLADSDRGAAIAAVAAVPVTSSHYPAAQIAAIRLLLAGRAEVTWEDLTRAEARLGRLPIDDLQRQQLTVEILHVALYWVTAHPTGATPDAVRSSGVLVLGCEPDARALRFGLEHAYLRLAALTPDPARKAELINTANAIRPRTLFHRRRRQHR
jgi:serine/threonine-protein kinase PknG